jgi:hypothetical protein
MDLGGREVNRCNVRRIPTDFGAAQRNGEVLDLGFLKCIDTGCESGGRLTGLDVVSGHLWKVDAQGRQR